MPTTHLILPPLVGNRTIIRQQLINIFLQEAAGTGTGDNSSKYVYQAEYLATGNRILLKRPAHLNKGMDFTVHVENFLFRNTGGFRDMPSHSDIVQDLLSKKQANPILYQQYIVPAIHNIYQCAHTINLQQIPAINAGLLSCEAVLLTIKWLFIEQDVTYWNWSGRAMLFQVLVNNQLC